MWFKIDYNKLVTLYLPTFLRKEALVSYLQVLIKPIDSLYYLWYNWRIENIYKVEHTGQICSLRGSLNDKFDPEQRRIYIGNGLEREPFYIFTEGENQQVWINTESEEDIIWLYTDAETRDSGYNFIVWVPQELYDSQIFGLRAHIDFYKTGGKNYTILIIP